MELLLKKFIFIIYFFNIQCNYILIPFDTFIYNKKYDNETLQKDILLMKYLEDMHITLSLGNPIQTIKLLLRLDQYEFIIKEPEYNSSLSNSFKMNKFIENKYICNDTFNFLTINSSKELNDFIHKKKDIKSSIKEKQYKEYQDIKFIYVNKTTNYKFLERNFLDEEIEQIKLLNYGMIGLRIRYVNLASSPDFIKSLKERKEIKSNIFSFYFNNNKKNDEPYGYLIIGDNFTDTEKEYDQINNTNFALRDSSVSWDLRADTIYSQTKIQTNKRNVYLEKRIDVQLKIEKSYILGSQNYKSFIDDIFFNDLVKENVCQFKKIKVENTGTYICNSKSKLFLEYYNNIFPDLVVKCNNFDDLILTKSDLFFYNQYNKSDTNIYFLIYFSTLYTTKWIMGRPLFEKYRFSFNTDTSFIMYHKKKFFEDKNFNKQKYMDNKTIKILIIFFLILIIFLLGFLFHKFITKSPRKQKANELDDDFDYSISKEKKLYNDLDVNSNKKENNNNLYLELGSKNY